MARIWALALAAMMLAGCASLTAEAPLYTPADQIGPAPLTEGIWVQVSDECPLAVARRDGRLPKACGSMDLRRLPDGAWILSPIGRAADDEDEMGPMRLIIAPATEHPSADAFAPLYVAEYAPVDPNARQGLGYAAIAPLGAMPAEEMFIVAAIGCSDTLRDGPIEGVREVLDERGERVGCIASTQTAVREATRRAVVENLNHLDEARLVLVRR